MKSHQITALYMACMLGPGNVELVKLLIEVGVDPNIAAVMTTMPGVTIDMTIT